MLRTCVLALACLAIVKSGPVLAEASKTEAESITATQSPSSDPGPAPSAASDAATSDTKPSDSATPVDGAKKAAESAAPAKPAAPAPLPSLKASIDLKTQSMTVSEHGDVTYTWPISSGTSEFPTPRGTFRPQWTAKMWYSKKYDNAPMPNAVFINGGVAVHATYHTGSLGRPASHGCIRLAPANAATFYRLVHKHGLSMTRVSVYGTPKWSAPAVASRKIMRDPQYPQYASQQDSGWFWDSPKYKTTSAYNPGFAQPRYRRPAKVYYYSGNNAPRVYRRADGARIVYQRPRRVYYYSGYSNGW